MSSSRWGAFWGRHCKPAPVCDCTTAGAQCTTSRRRRRLQEVLRVVRRRDPHQPEFHQAVLGVACALQPLFARCSELLPVFARMCEPERTISFRCVVDIAGSSLRPALADAALAVGGQPAWMQMSCLLPR